jgi:uncharacterized membrane protein YjdF
MNVCTEHICIHMIEILLVVSDILSANYGKHMTKVTYIEIYVWIYVHIFECRYLFTVMQLNIILYSKNT